MSNLAIEQWARGRLRPGRNPRTHPPAQIAKVVASINEYGWTNPILASADGEIIAGEARWLAAGELGMAQVPVIVLAELSPAQRLAYRVADNRIPLDGGWDAVALGEVLAEIEASAVDLASVGFDVAELDELLASGVSEPHDCPDPVLPVDPVSRVGDVWLMGPHRLICGDSTSDDVVGRLMGGAADLVVTDPPYGMSYDGGRASVAIMVMTDPPYGMGFGAGKEAGSTAVGATVKAHGTILGDDATGEDLVSLVGDALATARRHAADDAAFYVCLTWRTYGEFERALQACELEVAACIVWDKGSIGLGHQHYRPQHEFVFYCRGARWNGGKAESDVWTLSRGATGQYVHPTQKPVDLIARAVKNSSNRGDVVLDVFGGSGSTLIACEVTGRKARLVELDPKYCDVIVERWQTMTGCQAIHAQTRTAFAEMRH